MGGIRTRNDGAGCNDDLLVSSTMIEADASFADFFDKYRIGGASNDRFFVLDVTCSGCQCGETSNNNFDQRVIRQMTSRMNS